MDLAAIHHRDALAGLGDHCEVVGDQQDRRVARVLPQIEHEIEDLRLNGHVEGRGRLVGDQQVGLHCQRHGDHDPLPLPTRELVRITLQPREPVRDPDHFEQLRRPRVGRLLIHIRLVVLDRFPQLKAHREHRVQGRHGLLENHGDRVAAQLAHFLKRELGEVLAFEQDLARFNTPRGIRDQAQDRARSHRLAAARLAHEAADLVLADRETDSVDGLGGSAFNFEVGLESFDF